MTLTAIIGNNATSVVGPGIDLYVHTSLGGPYPVDDMFYVDVVATAGTLNGISIYRGDAFTYGYSTQQVILGVRQRLSTAAQYWAGRLNSAISAIDAADGQACRLDLIQYHYNFSVVDTGSLTGLTWTRIGNMSNLIAGLLAGSAGDADAISEILKAVRQVKTTPGQV
jgi:hypothetical protein